MARILVVDNTPTIRELYDDILSDEGHEVHVETGPDLDLDQVEQCAPNLIILGYLFGAEALGLVMLHHLRTRPTTVRIPIIMCTGADQHIKDVQSDLERQRIVVLPKPFAVDDLLALVEHALFGHGAAV
jgi:DNA-binding response OmpR family regulator